MDWNQISFEVNKNKVDLVSEVLTGLGSISISYFDALNNAIFEPPVGETPLWESVRITALFSSEINKQFITDSILEICNINVLDTLELKDRVWEEECQKNFPSMQFGKKLWVRPSWDSLFELPSDAVIINMDPGLAFGTGTHQTTSLCLEFLDENPPKGLDVIDFGCGTGILAIAAAKLGANSILAIDNDPQALISSQENAVNNNCESVIHTIHSMENDEYRNCDLLIANILANPLMELEPLFSGLLNPNGTLLLSGILKDQLERLLDCYSDKFMDFELANMDEWFRVKAKKRQPIRIK
tara:strand:+ start:170 stop:1066 length:897 start_codon:yes stop_codon:yes gene_type:complete